MILHQKNLNCKKSCKYSFGTYVQAHDKPNPKNTNNAQSLDGIYLHFTNAHQGRHRILYIQTNRIITRQNITILPTTEFIIDQVNHPAKDKNMPKSLKILT